MSIERTCISHSIQHVLKDKRVLAFVQRQVAEEEGRKPEQLWADEEIITFVRNPFIISTFAKCSAQLLHVCNYDSVPQLHEVS